MNGRISINSSQKRPKVITSSFLVGSTNWLHPAPEFLSLIVDEELYEVLEAGRWWCLPAAPPRRPRIVAESCVRSQRVRERFRHASTRACTCAGT
eukprot:1811797-Pyramimonas_sp.AAC.1